MKISIIELTDTQKQALEQGYKLGETAVYRQRCHLILLKSQGYKAKDIANILDTNIQSVYNWVKRYREHGIQGLQTKLGQGRKAILTLERFLKVLATPTNASECD